MKTIQLRTINVLTLLGIRNNNDFLYLTSSSYFQSAAVLDRWNAIFRTAQSLAS